MYKQAEYLPRRFRHCPVEERHQSGHLSHNAYSVSFWQILGPSSGCLSKSQHSGSTNWGSSYRSSVRKPISVNRKLNAYKNALCSWINLDILVIRKLTFSSSSCDHWFRVTKQVPLADWRYKIFLETEPSWWCVRSPCRLATTQYSPLVLAFRISHCSHCKSSRSFLSHSRSLFSFPQFSVWKYN